MIMENIRNRFNIKLISLEKRAKNLIAKLNYNSRTIFDESLTVIHIDTIRIIFNKPMNIGTCILNLSKILMYDFRYNYIILKYKDNALLLYTDTDSLFYDIKTEDIYRTVNEGLGLISENADIVNNHRLNFEIFVLV